MNDTSKQTPKVNDTIVTLAAGIGLGSLIVLGAVASASAQDTNTWNLEVPVAPSFCEVITPTVSARLTYNLTTGRWEVVNQGTVEFAMNNATEVSATTNGILTINGTPHPTPIQGIGYQAWRTITTDVGVSETSLADLFSTPDKPALMGATSNGIRIPVPAGATTATWRTGDVVFPPSDIILRNNDVATLTWNIECVAN